MTKRPYHKNAPYCKTSHHEMSFRVAKRPISQNYTSYQYVVILIIMEVRFKHPFTLNSYVRLIDIMGVLSLSLGRLGLNTLLP